MQSYSFFIKKTNHQQEKCMRLVYFYIVLLAITIKFGFSILLRVIYSWENYLQLAAELLTCIVYQPYMPTEIQPRYKTPTFDPFCSPPARHSYPSFSFSTVSLFMDNENGTFYQKCALWIAISQNRPKYFHK